MSIAILHFFTQKRLKTAIFLIRYVENTQIRGVCEKFYEKFHFLISLFFAICGERKMSHPRDVVQFLCLVVFPAFARQVDGKLFDHFPHFAALANVEDVKHGSSFRV